MTTVTYDRPSGNPITVNDSPETRALAEANGWTVAGEKKAAPKKEKPAK